MLKRISLNGPRHFCEPNSTAWKKGGSPCLVFGRFRTLGLQRAAVWAQGAGSRIARSSPAPAFGVWAEPKNDVKLSDKCLSMGPGAPCVIECSAAPGEVAAFSRTDMVMGICWGIGTGQAARMVARRRSGSSLGPGAAPSPVRRGRTVLLRAMPLAVSADACYTRSHRPCEGYLRAGLG